MSTNKLVQKCKIAKLSLMYVKCMIIGQLVWLVSMLPRRYWSIQIKVVEIQKV